VGLFNVRVILREEVELILPARECFGRAGRVDPSPKPSPTRLEVLR
jgi:hypothetical protein